MDLEGLPHTQADCWLLLRFSSTSHQLWNWSSANAAGSWRPSLVKQAALSNVLPLCALCHLVGSRTRNLSCQLPGFRRGHRGSAVSLAPCPPSPPNAHSHSLFHYVLSTGNMLSVRGKLAPCNWTCACAQTCFLPNQEVNILGAGIKRA